MKRMPRTPKYRHHKGSGQGFVELDGRRIYLGRWGLPETEQRYHRTVAEWIANGRRVAVPVEDITIVEASAQYLEWAAIHHSERQAAILRTVLRDLNAIYSRLPAQQFSPKKLMAVREVWVQRRLTVKTCNGYAAEIKRAFKWLGAHEVVSASVWEDLKSVTGLRRGRGEARDTDPVEPVSIEAVNAIEAHVSPQVWALVRLQLLTGARPSELLNLTPASIDTTGDVWEARLSRHKGAWRGKSRVLFFGERAQRILRPYLLRLADTPLFSPMEAVKALAQACPTHRRPDQVDNPRKTTREVGDRYTPASYRRAIRRACVEAGIAPWHPHQLRHTTATEARKRYGLDAAQALLGHSNADISQVYAQVDEAKARAIAAEIG